MENLVRERNETIEKLLENDEKKKETILNGIEMRISKLEKDTFRRNNEKGAMKYAYQELINWIELIWDLH